MIESDPPHPSQRQHGLVALEEVAISEPETDLAPKLRGQRNERPQIQQESGVRLRWIRGDAHLDARVDEDLGIARTQPEVEADDEADREFPERTSRIADAGAEVESDAQLCAAGVEGAAQQAVAQASRAQVFDAIGGEKNFTEMAEWAAENASPADLAAYNKAATSGDAATVKLAVEALYGRYTEATGSAPKLLGAGETTPTGGSTFGSWHEVQTAMSDPRYGPDDAYTRNLIAKLDRSKL